jgi:hypothetical protein
MAFHAPYEGLTGRELIVLARDRLLPSRAHKLRAAKVCGFHDRDVPESATVGRVVLLSKVLSSYGTFNSEIFLG